MTAPLALTMGSFDGVHLAHAEVIKSLVHEAKERQCLAALMTFAHLAASLRIRSPNSAGVLATGAKPSVSSFSFTSGSATSFRISALSLSITARGVFAGTEMPNHEPDSNLLTVSATVGISGAAGERLLPRPGAPLRLARGAPAGRGRQLLLERVQVQRRELFVRGVDERRGQVLACLDLLQLLAL